MLSRLVAFILLFAAIPAAAQELPEGQGEAEYRLAYESSPGFRGGVLSFEAWQQAAGVAGVLPTWQVIRTASMWRECGGAPFEVPPASFWPFSARWRQMVWPFGDWTSAHHLLAPGRTLKPKLFL